MSKFTNIVIPIVKVLKTVSSVMGIRNSTLQAGECLLSVMVPKALTTSVCTKTLCSKNYEENTEDSVPAKGIHLQEGERQCSIRKTGKDTNVQKYNLIKEMNFKEIEHSVPFYDLPTKTLAAIMRTTISDKKHNFCENRLYYLSEKLQCDPSMLSKILCKRTFIYRQISFPWLAESLKVLLEMGVPGPRIVRDLWVLKYYHETITRRLQHVLDTGRKDLAPWMVRCSEEILQKSLELSSSTKKILGDKENVHLYLAERLKTTADVVDEMCVKTPYLKTIRVTKVKNSLDYLFSEGFTAEDIINVPRILANSVRTIKTRVQRLKNNGIDIEGRLKLLSKSNKDFEVSYDCIKRKHETAQAKTHCDD